MSHNKPEPPARRQPTPEGTRVSPDQRALFQALLDAPDDDAPRLVYADWLEENGEADRAEFIRVGCALAGIPEDDPRRKQLDRREQQLRDQHEDAWKSALRQLGATHIFFERGFPHSLGMDAGEFVINAEALFAAAPLRKAELFGTFIPGLALATLPQLAQLEFLWLSGELIEDPPNDGFPRWPTRGGLSDPGLQSLAASPFVANLRELHLGGNEELTDASVVAVAASPYLNRLELLDFNFNRFGDPGLLTLIHSPHLRSLRTLRLWGTLITDNGLRALAASPFLARLNELNLSWCERFGEVGLVALLNSANIRGLKSLVLEGTFINAEVARAMLDSPHLDPEIAFFFGEAACTLDDDLFRAVEERFPGTLLGVYR